MKVAMQQPGQLSTVRFVQHIWHCSMLEAACSSCTGCMMAHSSHVCTSRHAGLLAVTVTVTLTVTLAVTLTILLLTLQASRPPQGCRVRCRHTGLFAVILTVMLTVILTTMLPYCAGEPSASGPAVFDAVILVCLPSC